MNELLIIIPIRGGSKRLPGKHLKKLVGSSLMERTNQAIIEAKIDAPCLLTTDCEIIANEGKKLGWMVPFLRPDELATDQAQTVPTVIHALDWYVDTYENSPSTIMVLQTTSPFRNGDILIKGLKLLKNSSESQAVISTMEFHRRAEHVFQSKGTGFLRALNGDDSASSIYIPNGALYLIRTEVLRKSKTLFPTKLLHVPMGFIESIDIDTELDWMLAESVIDKGLCN